MYSGCSATPGSGSGWPLVQRLLRPYRTIDDRIDGAVITFIDIDESVRAVAEAEYARDFAEGIVETVQQPLLVRDSNLRVLRTTEAFYTTFRIGREETIGAPIYDLGSGQWRLPELRRLLEEALVHDIPFRDLEITHDFPNSRKQYDAPPRPADRRIGWSRQDSSTRNRGCYRNARRLPDSVRLTARDGREIVVEVIANSYRVRERTLIQANIRDVTERRRIEEELRRSNLDLQQFAFAASHNLQEPLRTVISFLELFKRKYEHQLGSEADQQIGYITSAADHMRHLVLDLLGYSQGCQG
ncbi:MAG TPA: PAS domain S-box protein [Bryobacteraceae bacterium]|nr:PAS domain S-box protein [Bryobacteraceae bacterium]